MVLAKPEVEMGPLVSKQQLENVTAAVEQAVKDGAKVVTRRQAYRLPRRASISSRRF